MSEVKIGPAWGHEVVRRCTSAVDQSVVEIGLSAGGVGPGCYEVTFTPGRGSVSLLLGETEGTGTTFPHYARLSPEQCRDLAAKLTAAAAAQEG